MERAELPKKSVWRRLEAGDELRTGDTFRTAGDGTARLEFPWMDVTLGPGTMFTIPVGTVLSTVLEQGRAEFAGPGRDIVKILVGDGEVRGGGRLVLRRSVGRTSAAVLEGAFRVRARGRTVEIKAGQGTVVMDGRPPEAPAPLPAAPRGLDPGQDPAYVRSGQPVDAALDVGRPLAPRRGPRAPGGRGAPGPRGGRAAPPPRDPLARDLPLAGLRPRRARRREPPLGRGAHLLGGPVGPTSSRPRSGREGPGSAAAAAG